MPRNDRGGRDEKGMRNSHADSSVRESNVISRESNVISLDQWIKEERETIIRRAQDEEAAETPEPVDEEIDGGEEPEPETEDASEAQPERGEVIPLVPRDGEEDDEFFESEEDEEERLRRRRKAARVILLAVLAVVFIACALLAYFLLIVDSITVSGAQSYSDEELIEISGLRVGTHMWLNDIDDAKRAIETDPYIKEALVTRVYPDRITIKITERHEYAVIISLNTNAVIDEEGYVLEIGHRSDYAGLLTVYGTGSGGYHVNQRLGEESNFSSRTLTTMLSAISATGLFESIESVDISNPLSIYMLTYDGLKVQVGQPEDVEEKLLKMRAVMDKLRELGLDKSGTLDLSAKGDPVYSPPGGGTTIVGSVNPGGNADPNGSADPNATPNPDATFDPNATPNTDGTPNPDGTTNPAGTSTPDGTAVPAGTPASAGTPAPDPTPAPTQYYTGEPGFSG